MSSNRSNSKALLCYGDLVEVHAQQDVNVSQFVANALGLRYRVQTELNTFAPTFNAESFEFVEQIPAPVTSLPTDSRGYPSKLENIALWLPTQFSIRDQEPVQAEREKFQSQPKHWDGVWWHDQPTTPLPFEPLAPWSVLKGRIEKLTHEKQSSRTVDSTKLVSKIANGHVIEKVPKTEKSCSGQLVIIQDSSQRLTPFHEDHVFIIKQLKRERRYESIRTFSIRTNDQEDSHDRLSFELPFDTSNVLVCGDLGLLARTPSLRLAWLDWGRRASGKGVRLSAMVPFAMDQVPPMLQEVFRIESMQTDRNAFIESESSRREMLQALFVLASPSRSVSTRLLRALRRLLPIAVDASLESAFWQDYRLSSRHSEGATIRTDVVQQELKGEFEKLDRELQQSALMLIREYHSEMHPTMWLQTLLSLSPNLQSLMPTSDRTDAVSAIHRIDQLRKSEDIQSQEMECFMDRCLDHYTEHATTDPQVSKIIHQAWADLRPNDESKLAFRDPIDLPKTKSSVCAVSVTDRKVTVERILTTERVQLHSGYSLSSSNGAVQVELGHSANRINEVGFWKSGKKPDFVSDYGRDEYGAWFEFQLRKRNGNGVVTQRMRWIRPGTFMMGSLKDEPGQYNDEVLHQVTLTRGFWLADTTCTQAMWEAVLGGNPSHFKGEDRPVEQVSYDDAIRFCDSLSKQFPELKLQLPTEAQWEYSCRAGTQTPFSFGATISTDQANFDGNFPYVTAPKGIYRKQTVGVKNLPANTYGLYQMHGNVWEWCSDWYSGRPSNSLADPTGPMSGSSRVFRGGCWFGNARDLRSACRARDGSGSRGSDVSFRVLSSASAEPIEMAEVPVAEQGSELSRIGAAEIFSREFSFSVSEKEPVIFQWAPDDQASIESPYAERIVHSMVSQPIAARVVSDIEMIRFDRVEKPDWAVEFGRDAFGVYGDFELTGTTAAAKDDAVRQRLRFIPPGRFQMGSPPDEPGRFGDEQLHPVTISSGFWMFDAPCSQRLWTAIMEENPSHFPDPDRPVESIDWAQANEFAERLSQRLGGHPASSMAHLSFRLPTEAEWEYACRAGTSTAIYTGPLEIIGDANAPALDAIAWYGGNSGHRYDLDKPDDVSDYKWLSDKQFPFTHAGTRRIKQKAPNPWGLYDMLGNVWEWCSDWYAEKMETICVDPLGPDAGLNLVLRGGGWIYTARLARSACRDKSAPGLRDHSLGFRLLSESSPGPVAERVSGSRSIPSDEASTEVI